MVAQFSPGTGTLTVFGDSADNEIVISRDALGVISVNGEVPLAGGIPGGFPTVFNTKSISVFGLGGNDTIRLDETNGPLPAAQLFGGSGNDILTGGSGADALHGQDGNDQLSGGAGDDFLLGQSGTDVMFGGDGADQMFGGAGDDTADGDRGDDVAFLGDGNDLFVWDPGDGSDRVEGEAGFDTMLFNGSGADEVFEASANGPRLRFTRDVGNIVMDVDGVERVDVEALGGADTVTLNDLTGTAVQELRVDLEAVKDGGAADDKIDRVILNGTSEADFVSVLGQPGNLFVLGLPTFVTDPAGRGRRPVDHQHARRQRPGRSGEHRRRRDHVHGRRRGRQRHPVRHQRGGRADRRGRQRLRGRPARQRRGPARRRRRHLRLGDGRRQRRDRGRGRLRRRAGQRVVGRRDGHAVGRRRAPPLHAWTWAT